MKHAIEILEKELDKLRFPIDRDVEEDIYDAVIHFRKVTDIKLALKNLQFLKELAKELNSIK